MSLKIVTSLLEDLHSNNINYCHWKSNEHLDAALNADTDLDILFDKNQKEKVIEILEKHGFHLFEAVWYKKYHGIVDYIGFDQESAKIVHVHTHFHLDMGEVGIKSYSLPWEKKILETKKFDTQKNIYVSSVEMETLLLIVRTAFKLDRFSSRSNRKVFNDFKKEFHWLEHQLNIDDLRSLSKNLLPFPAQNDIEGIINNPNRNLSLFWKIKNSLKPHFAKHRVLSPTRVNMLKVFNLSLRIKYKLFHILRIKHLKQRRRLPNEGLVITLMGSDGAGKSTQTQLLVQELKKKVDVIFLYMGSGDGPKKWYRALTNSLLKILSKLKRKRISSETSNKKVPYKDNSLAKKNLLKQFLISLNSVALAKEKKSALKFLKRNKDKGIIIVCDRYPQTIILGYNDGPKLYENLDSKNIILRKMAQYEWDCYKLADKINPDLVIKLMGEINILHKRRPEMTLKELSKKQAGIAKLKFPKTTNVHELDIDRPIQTIKGEILDILSNQITAL